MKVFVNVAVASALLVPFVAAQENTEHATDASQEEQPTTERSTHQLRELETSALFVETFEAATVLDDSRWFKSAHEKYVGQDVRIDEVPTDAAAHLTPDHGLVLSTPVRYYGLAVKLDEPLQVDGSEGKKEMVVQYEVKLQKGQSCGGAYVKLLRQTESSPDYSSFSDSTPFVLMFGPDKCGASDKVHLIFQHKNPVSGVYEEKQMMEAPRIKNDEDTHLYTVVIRDDNSFEVLVDQESVKSGSLLKDFMPAVIPEKEIDDPEDSKPSDWVDEKKIRDLNAVKPDDWDEDAPARVVDEDAVKPVDWLDDEAAMIDDPDVIKPEDWDDEDDGKFVVPQIANPKCASVSGCGEWKRPTKANPNYKGKFYAPYIPNPAYKGEWKARKITNPDYFEDAHPARMDPIDALAVEVWTMTEGITFDNFWLGNDLKKAQEFAALTWAPKHAAEVKASASVEKESDDIVEGSVMKTLESFAAKFATYANVNPVIALGSIVGVSVLAVLGFFFLCCASGSPKPEKDEKVESGVEDKVETDVKAVDNDDKQQKLRQRKKAPKVD